MSLPPLSFGKLRVADHAGPTATELVIFDCDGVIVDSEGTTLRCLRANLAQHGLTLDHSEVADLVSARAIGLAGEEAQKMGAVLPDGWLDSFYDELYAELDREVTLISGIVEVFDALDAASIPYAVGSNGRREKMKVMLSRVGLWPRLNKALYSAQDLGAPKPAPDVFLTAAAAFCVQPQDCLVVEDSTTGAKAAVAAGIPCLGFCANTDPAKLAPYTYRQFGDMRELPAILEL